MPRKTKKVAKASDKKTETDKKCNKTVNKSKVNKNYSDNESDPEADTDSDNSCIITDSDITTNNPSDANLSKEFHEKIDNVINESDGTSDKVSYTYYKRKAEESPENNETYKKTTKIKSKSNHKLFDSITQHSDLAQRAKLLREVGFTDEQIASLTTENLQESTIPAAPSANTANTVNYSL